MTELAPPLAQWLHHYNELLQTWEAKGGVLSADNARENFALLTSRMVAPGPELALVGDIDFASGTDRLQLRLYQPQAVDGLPVLVYLHGGGHVAGSVEVYDPICRRLAAATGHLVVAVEYRLAPEHPFPAGLLDARQVLRSLPALLKREGITCGSVRLGGDSAGGAMAASLMHSMDPAEHRVDRLLLIYPSLDYTLSQPSVDRLGRGYLLDKGRIVWYFEQYFQGGQDRMALSPLFMEVPDGFPKTCIVSAGYCPLQDEARVYAGRLEEAGVEVEHRHFGEMLHAFLNLETLVPEGCQRFYQLAADFLHT